MKLTKSNQQNIVFLDEATVNLGDIDMSPLKKQGMYQGYASSKTRQILQRAQKAEIIITNKFVFDKKVVDALPNLKLLCVCATGVNNIDLETCKKRDIAVTNVPAYSTTTVAEHTLLFILAFAHRLLPHQKSSLDGTWSRSPHFAVLDFPFSDIRGKQVGLIGYGKIGREVKRLAEAFGMKVMLAALPGRKYTKREGRVSLKNLLKSSDFVSIHCPLSRLTYHLIGTKELKLMKKGAYLINMARGSIVDEKAVTGALKKNLIAGYGTDVLSQEPPQKNNPLFHKSLRSKILITPHVAWASIESRQKLIDEMAKNIAAFKEGSMRNRIV